MAPKLKSRKSEDGKETTSEDLMFIDPSPTDMEMQDASQEAASPLTQVTVPPAGFQKSSQSSDTLSHPSSHTLSHGLPPAQIRISRRPSVPSRSSSPSSSVVDITKRPSDYSSDDEHVSSPPGYIRHPGPTRRQSDTNDWPHGVLSGGVLIRFLEDLSRSSRRDHWQVCTWLENFAARFGRFHNLDGLVVTNAQDMHMLMLAHKVWLETKSIPAEGDIFWVPGLEPAGDVDPDWEAKAKNNLPKLSSTHSQKHWMAGEAQYLHGTSTERPRKGNMVCERWIDGMGWEREIWQA
ncbi:hypothetical protein J4E82_000031 [Alternaria postmessia]|uniref:uncharacterized protein n=1 Tax=Alternaria postmessia TaxID=1187938 RepID=UPI002224AC8D|nr:uncharacterized protein J4E82_000031 [Alternaria postmessia]KAI5380834.1 hypothetical protein J4E82_000031 [Alternaria postmessia]